jgi:hypothetical protein
MLYHWLLASFLGHGWLTWGQTRVLLRAFRGLAKAVAAQAEQPAPSLKVRRSMKLSLLWALAVVLVVHRNLVASGILVLASVAVLRGFLFFVSLRTVAQ